MNKGVYTIKCVANNKMLNLYAAGVAANGTNVVMYSSDGTAEQKWFFDGKRLRTCTNRKYCLDRYAASPYVNNADVWEANDDTNQIVVIEPFGSDGYSIKLKSLVGGNEYYLTSKGSVNGNGTDKSPDTAGNIFWATWTGNNYQKWKFTNISAPGNAVPLGLEDIDVPLPEYPAGSYWTTDGAATNAAGAKSKSFNGIQCAGFARYVYYCMWGNEYYGTQISARTLSGTAADFADIEPGARINCRSTSNNHSMILLKKDSSGVTVYDVNWDGKCGVDVRTYTYAAFKTTFTNIKNTSYTPYPS